MISAVPAAPETAAPAWVRRHRLTVAEYYRMGELGIIAPDARVELINGEIIEMPPINSAHAGTVDHFNHILVNAVGERAVVSVQNPIILGEYSVPQPDLCLLKAHGDHYKNRNPQAGDVLLAIEVADSSLAYDWKIKSNLYARFRIAEMWLVDVNGRHLWGYSALDGQQYGEIAEHDLAKALEPVALPGCRIDLVTLF